MTILNVNFSNGFSMKYASFPDECESVEIFKNELSTVLNTKNFTDRNSLTCALINAMSDLKIEFSILNPEYDKEYVLDLGDVLLVIGEAGDYIRVVKKEENEEILYNVDTEIIDDPSLILGSTLGVITPYGTDAS